MTEGRRARARRWQNAAVRVLLVEDDARMRAIVRRGLVESAHAVETADSAHGALLAAAAGRFDAAVLDVMLPDGSGLDVVRTLRGRGDATPILLLTARDTADDITAGLDAGADDYLVKPFAFKVLLARLRALGRRSPVVDTPIRRVADLAMDDAAHLVTRSGTPIALTRTEYGLLDRLMRRANRVVTRAALLDVIGGGTREVENNTLDAFIMSLRHKIETGGRSRLIQTVRGVGYSLRDEGED